MSKTTSHKLKSENLKEHFPRPSGEIESQPCVSQEIATDNYIMRLRQMGQNCEVSFHFKDAWVEQFAVKQRDILGRGSCGGKVHYSIRGNAKPAD
jgi:hypothetical protein